MNKSQIPNARPTFEIDLQEKIICFDSSQYGILLLGFKRHLSILTQAGISAPSINFDWKKIRDIKTTEVRILKLCTSIIVRDVLFASAANYVLKVFVVNEEEEKCLKSIEAHEGYINSIDFSENYLATGSDDHTCKIFSVRDNYEEHSVLNFAASVTCVKFNSEELNKLIIAVKTGSIFIYCMKLRQSLYSFQTLAPLLNFDWSNDPRYIAVLCVDQVIYFDISKPDTPIYSKRLNDLGKIIKIHPQIPLVSASICTRAGTELVIHQKSNIPIFSTKISAYANNITWSGSFLITGSDRKLCFFKIPLP